MNLVKNSRIGFTGFNGGIGDQIMVSSFPENFYRNYNKKLIDINNLWVFDHNPYVDRNINPDIIADHLSTQIEIIKSGQRKDFKSDAEEICSNFRLPKCYLRSPRLYKYEDSKTEKDLVIIHTTGKTVGHLPDNIIEQILKNYSDYRIIQIGLSTDKETPFEKFLDKTKWETAELISKAAIYIGVNSGFYHVANCYPKVRKKIILHELTENILLDFEPKKTSKNFEWYDYNLEYFNIFNYDVGVTNSFKKI
jgi:hypothetical protein